MQNDWRLANERPKSDPYCKYDLWLADESLSCYTVICTIMIATTKYDFMNLEQVLRKATTQNVKANGRTFKRAVAWDERRSVFRGMNSHISTYLKGNWRGREIQSNTLSSVNVKPLYLTRAIVLKQINFNILRKRPGDEIAPHQKK